MQVPPACIHECSLVMAVWAGHCLGPRAFSCGDSLLPGSVQGKRLGGSTHMMLVYKKMDAAACGGRTGGRQKGGWGCCHFQGRSPVAAPRMVEWRLEGLDVGSRGAGGKRTRSDEVGGSWSHWAPREDRATEQGRLVDEGRAPGSLDFILTEVSWECRGSKMAWTTLYIKNISPEE